MNVLGVKIDDKLNFIEDIQMCSQRPVGIWIFFNVLKKVLDYKSRMAIYKSFIGSNFNYRPIVWMFTCTKSLNRIENIKKRALRFVLDDYESSYHDLLTQC